MDKEIQGKIAKRIKDTEDWLILKHPDIPLGQKHLDEDTDERAYWHYGYLIALKDIQKLIREADNKALRGFLDNIRDVHLALRPSSWGRLQCNAETAGGQVYHSWSGDPSDKISVELIIEAFELIGKQFPDEVESDKLVML